MEARPTGAAGASFSGCASASGPRLPGSGLRPLQAQPSGSAAPFLDPRVGHAAGRLRLGSSRGSPRRVRFLLEAWPQRQSERTEAFFISPPPPHNPGTRRLCGTRRPFPPGPQAGGPGACEAAGEREGRPRSPAAPRAPRPPRPRRPRGSEAARPSLRRASALAPRPRAPARSSGPRPAPGAAPRPRFGPAR